MPVIKKALNIKDLSLPPLGKTGWPWTEGTEPLPDRMPNGSEWPRISIVTPSYNQGQFIEETIRSVLLQGYPNLEYIICDGGSTDNTIEIIKKYEQHLTYWVSEKDRGQGHAINKGFARATGEILNWINSDDWFDRKVFASVAEKFYSDPSIDVIYGRGFKTDLHGNNLRLYTTGNFGLEDLIQGNFFILQPTTFYRSKIWHDYGQIDEALMFALDYDLWLRWFLEGVKFCYYPESRAFFRIHSKCKSSTLMRTSQNEVFKTISTQFKNGKLPSAYRKQFEKCIYGFCNFNYAQPDSQQFWIYLNYYRDFCQRLPEVALLWKALLMAILREKGLVWCRKSKRKITELFSNKVVKNP